MQNIGLYSKYNVPSNPLEAEDKEKGMFPTKNWKNEKLRKYYQRIWSQLSMDTGAKEPGGRGSEFWNSYFYGQEETQRNQSVQALKTAVAFKILQLADGEIDQEIDEKFVEEFINW